MATRKNARKTTKKVDLSGLSEFRVNSKTKKNAEKALKKTSAKVIAFALVTLLIGLLLGAGAWWIVCRNDCFALVGQETVSLTLEEKYVDEGVDIVAFGKDVKDSVTIETNLKCDSEGNLYSDEVGTFYIIYK